MRFSHSGGYRDLRGYGCRNLTVCLAITSDSGGNTVKTISIIVNKLHSIESGQVWGEEIIAGGMQKGIREYGYEAVISSHSEPEFTEINIVFNRHNAKLPKYARNFFYYVSFDPPKNPKDYEKILIPSNRMKNDKYYFLPPGAREELGYDEGRDNLICYPANRIVTHKYKNPITYRILEESHKKRILSLFGAGWHAKSYTIDGKNHKFDFGKSYKGRMHPTKDARRVYSRHPFTFNWRTGWQIKYDMIGSRIMDCQTCGSVAIVDKNFGYDFPGIMKIESFEDMMEKIGAKMNDRNAFRLERHEISKYMKENWNYKVLMEKMIKDLKL